MIEYKNPYDELTEEVIDSIWKVSEKRNYPSVWTVGILCSLTQGKLPTAEDIQRILDIQDDRVEELIDAIHKDLDERNIQLPPSAEYNEDMVIAAADKYALLVSYCLN